jgi:GT2 family glycosyltransferase
MLLGRLLADLRSDPRVEDITVSDNGIADMATWSDVERACAANGARFFNQRGVGFYAMWNHAIDRAAISTERVAILNDDILIPELMITHLEHALVRHHLTLVCPDYHRTLDEPRIPYRVERVQGTYRHGGVTGSAFLLDAVRAPLIDERFRIWYGDDDLVWKIHQEGGSIGILRGLPLDHLGSVTVNSVPWLPEAIRDDVALWESLGRGAA